MFEPYVILCEYYYSTLDGIVWSDALFRIIDGGI